MSRSTLSESHAPILLPRPSQLAESASEEPPGSFQRPLWRNAASSPTEEELLPAFATIALPCQGHTAAQDTNTKPSSVPLKQVYSIARSRQHRLSHPPLRSFKARFMYYFCHYILASRSRKSGRDDDDDNRINTELPVGL
ncbi:hypothetical protein EV182_005467 [Spiromyces aspiralis]|uniref:Uncharacterized protein n=1 Tax=Spiromyces aspiralis TaxID=68401 RepID=A0ACC1HMK6_9FUNG|nr:hypothetical protein EV182_005467 [Spiromyces aspiralis]